MMIIIMVERYLRECQFLYCLHHPNITLFLGLCFLPGIQTPLLVMEQLEGSLDDFLEFMPPHSIPLPAKHSILTDTARGLLYLHGKHPPVIHRDLTAKNVLLTSSLVAKISDISNSRLSPDWLKKPGRVMVYMPPECQQENGPAIDIFSFGNLAVEHWF